MTAFTTIETITPVRAGNGTAGVYQIRNLNNGKIYVGSAARSLSLRKNEHWSTLRNQKHKNDRLQKSWNKHGELAFMFEVLITCDPSMCIWYEQQFLDQWEPEYNLNPRAESPLGVKHTIASRQNMSVAARNDPLRLERLTEMRSRITEETCRKISNTLKLKKIRPPSRLGTKDSEETRARKSESAKRSRNERV